MQLDCMWEGRREEVRHSLTSQPSVRRDMSKTTGDCPSELVGHTAEQSSRQTARPRSEVGQLAASISLSSTAGSFLEEAVYANY